MYFAITFDAEVNDFKSDTFLQIDVQSGRSSSQMRGDASILS